MPDSVDNAMPRNTGPAPHPRSQDHLSLPPATMTLADPRGDDPEKAIATDNSTVDAGSSSGIHGRRRAALSALTRHARPLVHLTIFLLFTGWWVASIVCHRSDKNLVVPSLLWAAITLRLVFFYVPARIVSNPIRWAWKRSAVRIYERLPPRSRTPAGAVVALAAVLTGSFASAESADNTRMNRAVSLFGMLVFIGAMWATSKHRRAVNWRTVIGGMLAQYLIGLFVLRTGVGYSIFGFVADRAADFLGCARAGVAFLTSDDMASSPYWVFSVLPAMVFFIAVVQVLQYAGFVQWFVVRCAKPVFWALGVSGAEAVIAAATPFVGQGESALLARPFVPHMTRAELHQVLTCGFATISGSALVGYSALGLNREALVSSCVMSIPASLAMSKLRYPETEETLTAGRVVMPEPGPEDAGDVAGAGASSGRRPRGAENVLHAFAEGAGLAIRIAGTIIATVLCIIALVTLIDGLLTWWGRYININEPALTLETILGYCLYPVAFLLGVPRDGDLLKVARLIAEKIITNEYKAFVSLTTDKQYADLSPRSRLIATYALCGFGNVGSLGVQVGILGQLAPERGGDVSRLAISALVSGVLATLTSASVAGLVVTDQLAQFSTKES